MKKIGIFVLLVFGVVELLIGQLHQKESELEVGKLPDMVYPKYRRWMSPDNGDTTRFKSPSFQWPSRKKEIFELRIAKNKAFTKELIEIKNIPFSMYNVHKRLSNGTWYWKYKSQNSAWSEIATFNISDTSIDFVPPPFINVYKGISRNHPRVLVHQKDWKELRSKAKEYKESKNIIEKADKIIGLRIPTERDAATKLEGRDKKETEKIKKNSSQKVGYEFGRSLQLLTQAYVLTKDVKYFNEAKKWMQEASTWDPKGLTHLNDFGDSSIMESLALAVDIFWDQLSDLERGKIIVQISDRADGFYDSWKNYLENRNSSMHVWQHILHRLFLTSLALVDEVPQAKDWLEYIYEIWLAQHPKMGVEDGAWFNGTGYVRMGVMTAIDIPLKLGQITGKNFFILPWYHNFMKWMSYAYPPGATSDGFCNDGKKWPMPNLEYGAFSDALARVTQDPIALKYSNQVFEKLEGLETPIIDLDYTGGPLKSQSLTDDMDYAWFRITQGYEMELPNLDNMNELPSAALFEDVGVAYMNTDKKNIKNNLRVSIKSSPMGPLAHTHAEHNTFNIAYQGKRLFYNSGYRPWMSAPHTLAWYKHTQGHNGILVDQEGQPYDAGGYGFLPRFINGEKLTYVLGDASHAYQAHELPAKSRKDNTPNDMGVKFFRRHYLLLKPDIFIVYDDMEAYKAVDWSWMIHNYHGLKLDYQNKTLETTYTDRGGRLTLYGGKPIDYIVTDKFKVEPKNYIQKTDANGDILEYKNHWHFKSTTLEKQKKMRFLAIIQVSDDLSYDKVIQIEKGNEFHVSGWKIKANMDVNIPGKIVVESKLGDVKFLSHDGAEGKVSKLFEKINGKDVVKSVIDRLPKSIISASKR
tara:strand:- start:718 stop:3306 length:2589 start_codon:yes stop_codon:yes gene_type:complete